MQIQPISNNQQTFKGYIKPEFCETIKYSLKKAFEDCETNSSKKDKYNDLLKQGKIAFEKLKKFVAPLHKDTYIEITEIYLGNRLCLSNPIVAIAKDKSDFDWLPNGIVIYNGDNNVAQWSANKDSIFIHNATVSKHTFNMDNLKRTQQIIDAIDTSIKPEEIDEAFLRMAERNLRNYSDKKLTGIYFIDRFLINRVVKKIEKYAKSIGKTTEARTIAEDRFKKLMEIRQGNAKSKQEKRQLTKRFNHDVSKLM